MYYVSLVLTKFGVISELPRDVVTAKIEATQLPPSGSKTYDVLSPCRELRHVHNSAIFLWIHC